MVNPALGPILNHFQDKAGYWSEIAIFHALPAFDVLVTEVPVCWNIAIGLIRKKTRTVWIPASRGKKTQLPPGEW